MSNSYSELTFAVLLTIGLVSDGMAAEFDYEFRIGGSYSDNIRRADTEEEDQSIALGGLKLNFSGESRRFRGNFSTDMEYSDYLDDAYDQEEFSSVSAGAVFKIAPDVFDWVFEEKFGKIRSDPFVVDTPDNRENLNTFATGPNLTFQFGDRTSIDLQGRYRDTRFEVSDSDNTTTTGTLSMIRGLSPNRTLSLNISADQVEYENTTIGGDIERRRAYLGFSSRNSRGSLQINVGVNELDYSGNETSGTLASLSLTRDLSEKSTLSLDYNQSFSDAGDSFFRFDTIDLTQQDGQNVVPTSDSFENQRILLTYSYKRNRTTFSVSGFVSDAEYQQQITLNNRRTGGRANWSSQFASGWNMGAGFTLLNWEFDQSNRIDDYLNVRLNIGRRLNRMLWLTFEYLYTDRSSNVAGLDYSENRYSLYLKVRPKS